MKDTTQAGDVAELVVAAELLRRGYKVARPLSNGIPYDLIVDTGLALLRVQVKRARLVDGVIRCRLVSNTGYNIGGSFSLYAGKVDCVVVADVENHKFYVFDGDDLTRQGINLRVVPAKNNQTTGVRTASDHHMDRLFPDRMIDGGDDA